MPSPQDPLEGQVAIGIDDSLSWYSNGDWRTHPGSVVAGNPPQDSLEGEIAIGTDHSLCWYSNGQWHGVAGTATIGNPPQDSIEGEVAVGSDNGIFWFTGGTWYGVAPAVAPPLGDLRLNVGTLSRILIADSSYLVEVHYQGTGTITSDWYINGTFLGTNTLGGSAQPFQGMVFGSTLFSHPFEPTHAEIVYYYSNFRIGTTRHGSDLWNEYPVPTSIPTAPPYDSVHNPTVSGSTGFVLDSSLGFNYIKTTYVFQSSGAITPFAQIFTPFTSTYDLWVEFHVLVPMTALQFMNDNFLGEQWVTIQPGTEAMYFTVS